MRRLLPTLLIAWLAAAPAWAGTVLYLAHANANDEARIPTAAAAMAFKRAVEARCAGALRVEVFPDAQLGADSQVVELVRKGVIHSAIISVGGLGRLYPRISVLDYPFAWNGLAETYHVFDGPFMVAMRQDFRDATGMHLAGFADTGGLFALTNSRRPIRRPDDMAGLRVRTMGVDAHKEMVRALGAEPVEVPWSELGAALRGGLVDGQMNPPSIIRFGRLNETQSHLTVTDHLYTPYPWLLDSAFLGRLGDCEREAVEAGIGEGVAASRRLAATQADALGELAGTMTITTLTEAEREAFRAATQPAVAAALERRFGAEGAALLRKLVEAIAAARR